MVGAKTEFRKKVEKVEDVALERGLQRLTREKIKKVFDRVVNSESGSRLKAYTEMCVRCGLCSQGCHYFLSHDGDPSYSPVAKVQQTMWELLKKNGNVEPEFMYTCAQIAYTECNLCRRCAMYCPFGIDTAYIMQLIRRMCHLLGMTPQYMQDTAHSHSATMNQMWVKDDEWVDSLFWQEEEARDEVPSLRIPMDKEGADILYSVIAPEPKFQTHLIYLAAVLMNETGMDWTMMSQPGWDNSDMTMFSGDFEMTSRLKRLHFETAQKLKVNRVVMGECGHAFRSVYDVGNRMLGWRQYPVPIIHAVEFYWELLDQGKLKIAKKFEEPVTIHDPCNIARGKGLHEKAREVARALCTNVIEMYPNREHNYCCGAGGGVINCGPPFKNVRLDGIKVKSDQLRETGAKVVIAPCHNCHSGIEDILSIHGPEMHTKFFLEIIYECMEKPNAV